MAKYYKDVEPNLDSAAIVALREFLAETERDLEKRINGLYIDYKLPLKEAQKEFEKSFLESHLILALGNKRKVAETTGWGYSTVRRKIKELDIKAHLYDIKSGEYQFQVTRADIVNECAYRAALNVLPKYADLPMFERLETLIKKEKLPMTPKILHHNEALRNFNQRYINAKVQEYGTMTQAAKAMGIAQSTLTERIKKHCPYMPISENEHQLKSYSQ